jgi:hypothetical protein
LTNKKIYGTIIRLPPYPNMQITRDKLNHLREMQEDVSSYFTEEYFPISGETYWICVQCLAETKLAELRGELVYEN